MFPKPVTAQKNKSKQWKKLTFVLDNSCWTHDFLLQNKMWGFPYWLKCSIFYYIKLCLKGSTIHSSTSNIFNQINNMRGKIHLSASILTYFIMTVLTRFVGRKGKQLPRLWSDFDCLTHMTSPLSNQVLPTSNQSEEHRNTLQKPLV